MALNTNIPTDAGVQQSRNIIGRLVDDSRELPTSHSELGSIQLSINEIRRRAHELRSNKDESSDHSKAHYLLAASGLPLQDIDSSLQELKPKQILEQIVPRFQGSNLDAYLVNKKNESILFSIEHLLTDASHDFNNFVDDNLKMNWKDFENDVRGRFGINSNIKEMSNNDILESSKDHTPPSWGAKDSSVLNNGTSKVDVNANQLVREKFESYAKIIYLFNNSRISSSKFSLTAECLKLLEARSDFRTKHMLEAWKFLDSYDKSHGRAVSSKKYLEKQFFEYVDNLYKNKINEGLPTNINKITSFIQNKLRNSNGTWKTPNLMIVNGTPIWALIFYLLRAGLVDDALEVLFNNKSSFKKMEHSFIKFFKAYASSSTQELPSELSNELHTEYNQHIKSSLDGDPFRLAVYKIIGRCDLTNKNIPEVTMSIEDWLWLHLTLVKENYSNTDPIYEKFSLKDFQDIVTSYGSSKFPNQYLQVLLLSGLFELAIDYAYHINEMDAVHLAIGFANNGLLKVQTESSTMPELVSMGQQGYLLDFARLLGNYTKSFRYSDPRIASEYLSLIALVDDDKLVKICHAALRELVLETNEFSILLGRVNRDGSRVHGVIEERLQLLKLADENQFLHTITEQAARKADDDGRLFDSLLLYQLSEEYNIVISIINDILGGLLSNSDLQQNILEAEVNSVNDQQNPLILAGNLVNIYFANPEISKQISVKNRESCFLLLKLAEIRTAFQKSEWQYLLSQVEDLDILPFTGGQTIRRKAQEFSTLNANIMKCIPNLLVMTMTSISKLIHSLRESSFASVSIAQQISSLKTVAKNCMIYAGMIQYKMPREVYSVLIDLDVSLEIF
ncbi:Nucleoporin NIC96 [Nakaseomyces bracarensis]|uniref:Nuclear pore protein n=1 Tax=Nakaseomyces bracarensis TaxID=273131 RepID=A0ABR4NXL0_9SACH